MSDVSFEIARSALQYPQKFDATLDSVFFIPLSQEAYRKASFLDDRVLTTGKESRWVPYADVQMMMSEASNNHPLHFIFHTGHVGSTLLSRLVEEAPGVLGLREPLPLRTLAELQDQNAPQLDARLDTFIKLWRRGFADTTHVVVKATSSSGRLAKRLLGASPTSQAVYLNLRAEPYLATLLAGANAMVDLNGFGAERASRLRNHFGLSLPPWTTFSIGELVAMSWAVESLTREETKASFPDRVMLLDFDSLLANWAVGLGAVLDKFAIRAPAGFLTAVEKSAVLTRYSKAPEQHAYSPALRSQLLNQARRDHAAELSKGLRFLEGLAKQDSRVAAIL
ncbi:MAG TPA: hypothetical protein VGJ08_00760 [Rhizomicrobium sp.]